MFHKHRPATVLDSVPQVRRIINHLIVGSPCFRQGPRLYDLRRTHYPFSLSESLGSRRQLSLNKPFSNPLKDPRKMAQHPSHGFIVNRLVCVSAASRTWSMIGTFARALMLGSKGFLALRTASLRTIPFHTRLLPLGTPAVGGP